MRLSIGRASFCSSIAPSGRPPPVHALPKTPQQNLLRSLSSTSQPSTERSPTFHRIESGYICAGAIMKAHTIMTYRYVTSSSQFSMRTWVRYRSRRRNPRHEHEWTIFETVKLPPGKVLIPGVIELTHKLHRTPPSGRAAYRAVRGTCGARERHRRNRLRICHFCCSYANRTRDCLGQICKGAVGRRPHCYASVAELIAPIPLTNQTMHPQI